MNNSDEGGVGGRIMEPKFLENFSALLAMVKNRPKEKLIANESA